MNERTKQYLKNSVDYSFPSDGLGPPTELDSNGNIVPKKRNYVKKKKKSLWKPHINQANGIIR
jgi:hypothetical protein